MRDCEREDLLCTCIDWGKDDLAVRIHHIICNFEFTGFELEYTTLELPEGRRLCRIGRCRACGKRLCCGDDLPAQSTPDDLLADIFRRALRMWNAGDKNLPAGVDTFADLFLSLFHEPDREFVSEWLKRLAADARLHMSGEGT